MISRALKGLAREVGVPVIAASQLSRAVESRAGKKPQLSDLRESGSIEQDADIVVFLHHNADDDEDQSKVRERVVQMLVEKHRHGPTGKVDLLFLGHQTKFVDMATVSEEAAEEVAQW